jgi:hypothetical protein
VSARLDYNYILIVKLNYLIQTKTKQKQNKNKTKRKQKTTP